MRPRTRKRMEAILYHEYLWLAQRVADYRFRIQVYQTLKFRSTIHPCGMMFFFTKGIKVFSFELQCLTFLFVVFTFLITYEGQHTQS